MINEYNKKVYIIMIKHKKINTKQDDKIKLNEKT